MSVYINICAIIAWACTDDFMDQEMVVLENLDPILILMEISRLDMMKKTSADSKSKGKDTG